MTYYFFLAVTLKTQPAQLSLFQGVGEMSIFAHSSGVLCQNWVRFGRVLLNDPYSVFLVRMKSNYLNEVIASLKEKKKCSIWVLCQFLLQNFLQKNKGLQLKELKSSACAILSSCPACERSGGASYYSRAARHACTISNPIEKRT